MPASSSSTDSKVSGRARNASVLLWLLVWEVAALLIEQPLILPGPVEAISCLGELMCDASVWSKLLVSGARVMGGLLAAYVVALALASVSHRNVIARELARPPLLVFKATPVVCVVVLLLIWLGAANVSIAAVFLMALPAIYFSALEGLDHASAPMAELMEVHGVSGLRRVLAYSWPELLPYLCATSEAIVGMSWKAGVAAELIGMPAGTIGERIYQAKLLLETGDLFAWTFIVVACASLCERIALWLLGLSGSASLRLACRLRAHGARGEAGELARGAMTVDGLILPHGAAAGHPVSLSLASAGRLCVMAPSGAGKTTLLRVLAGLDSVDAGRADLASRVSVEFQDARLFEDASALVNVLLFASPRHSEKDLEQMLALVLPDVDARTPVHELSGGQRRRVELVRALAAPGDAVLLDEPFAGLDADSRDAACAFVVSELRGRSLVVASHDEGDAARLGARVLVLPF